MQVWADSEGSFEVIRFYPERLRLFLVPNIGILWLSGWVRVWAPAKLWLLLISIPLLLLIHRRDFIRVYSGCFLHPTWSLSGFCSNCSGHRLVALWGISTTDDRLTGPLLSCGPRPPEDGVIGEWDVHDAELRDDIEWIGTDWEFSHEHASFLSNS